MGSLHCFVSQLFQGSLSAGFLRILSNALNHVYRYGAFTMVM
jgi:hypothetical protein